MRTPMMGMDMSTIVWGLVLCVTVTIAVDIAVLWLFSIFTDDQDAEKNDSSNNLKP